MHENIRTFKAATVEDALAQIRREMGFDAIVVETKQIERRSLLPWVASRHEVEVKAARVPAQQRAQTERQSTGARTLAAGATLHETVADTRTLSRKTTASAQRASSTTASATIVPPRSSSLLSSDLAPPPSLLDQPRPLTIKSGTFPSGAASAPRFSVEAASWQTPKNRGADAAPLGSLIEPSDIEQRLDSLQQMIAELGRRTRPRGLIEIPPELFAHYLALIEADVDDEIARDLIAKLQQHAAPGQLTDTVATTSLLAALIEREIRCAEPIAPKRGCRQVAMLVGPTGVGKTTTIAKLAGRFGVSHGLKVGLITVDTYRVAAVDQLRTYAEIIDLPMQVVTTPEELPAALAQFAEFDLVLIDTAGCGPHDGRRLEEIKQLVEAATPDHVYLVLSLASGAKPLRTVAERFAAVRPTSLILTKLDEAAGCGAVLSASRDIVLPVTYLTAGQEVPRDIEPANPCRIARLILGRDRLILDRSEQNPDAVPCPLAPALRREG